MGLYRRIGALANQADIDSFAAELVDRFGKMPHEAEFLLNTVALKLLCRAAGVSEAVLDDAYSDALAATTVA